MKKLLVTAIALSLVVLLLAGCYTKENKNVHVSLKWRIENSSYCYSSPVVVGDVVYVVDRGEYIYAIDKETGELIWQFYEKNAFFTPLSVVDGVVYIGKSNMDPDANDYLYAIDAASGNLKWQLGPGSASGSPVVADGIVYIDISSEMFYAVDAYSGEFKWRFEAGKRITSNLSVANGAVFFGSLDKHLYAVDAKNGELKWRYKTDYIILYISASIAERIVFVRTWEDIPTDDSLYSYKSEILYAIDTNSGELKWKNEMKWTGASSPSVVEGIVYIGSEDSNLYALDISSGEVKWFFKTGGPIKSSPSVVDGVVYVGSDDHYLYVIDSNSGNLMWRYNTIGTIFYSIVVNDDVIYFGTERAYFTFYKRFHLDSYLYALEIKK